MRRWLTNIGYMLAIIVLIIVAWLATTDNNWVWPRRNYLQYQVLTQVWEYTGKPQTGNEGSASGTIVDIVGRPIQNGWIVFSRWDGTTFTARTDANGNYNVTSIPAGSYHPVVGATGYDAKILGVQDVTIVANQNTGIDTALATRTERRVLPGTNLKLGEPDRVACEAPLPAEAIRREVTFSSAGKANQLTLLYSPPNATPNDSYPLLLAVYPGPADTWECATVPLAAAGYTVIAVGPAYSLELENDVDELIRILDFAEAGNFPNITPNQVGLLGGSYSGLHVQLLLRRGRSDIKGAVLLGAPTDLYAMRRHLEEGTFIPPFGLDQILVALGLPDREPLRYWEGSSIFHVQPNFPPHLIIHSRSDEVVPISQSDLLVEQLNREGIAHDAFYFDEASHYLLSPGGESREIYDLTIEFLATYLQP